MRGVRGELGCSSLRVCGFAGLRVSAVRRLTLTLTTHQLGSSRTATDDQRLSGCVLASIRLFMSDTSTGPCALIYPRQQSMAKQE